MKHLFFLFLLIFTKPVLAKDQYQYQIEHASVGAYAVNMRTGQVLIDEYSDMSLMPGSCIKLITTAAALELLGPESRFETHLQYDGTIQKGVLHGNLYIRGGGDPCLGSFRFVGWQKQTELWVEAIEKLGIQTIEGSVIGDATAWEKALAVPTWCWEDLGNYYGAGACALTFHENLYSLVFKPGEKVGAKTAIVRLDPPASHFTIQSEVTTGPVGSGDRACIYGSEYSPLAFAYGTIPAGVSEFAIKGAIADPPAFCAQTLADALKERGIAIKGKALERKNRTSFHTTYSPPLSEIVYWTNQKSINLYSEHLLKKMGQTLHHQGSTGAGIAAVTDFLASKNIDLQGLFIADGSGLSRKNILTAKQLVSLLVRMKSSPHFSLFLQSLPTKLQHIRVKTGSFSPVRCYAGYAGDIAFALLVNHITDWQKALEKTERFLSNLDQLAEGEK
jgi:D-alanyl-D-alanine carboxypeptidase/D-alanyl-D-alanine-endopeptidase (penicillin-binding protein 4)